MEIANKLIATELRKSRPKKFLLSVVIPCYNEEEVITTLYSRVTDALGKKNFRLQIIFVDDGSKDQTGNNVARIAAVDSRVKLVTLSRNFGHQAAVSAGLVYSDGDVTAVLDADLQDPPEVILEMIDRWLEGFDIVYGIRTKRKEKKWKKYCYELFYLIFRKVASVETPLDAGDFSLIDRQVLEEINRLPEKNRFFRGLRAWVGFSQIGVEYERAARAAGITKYPFLKLLKLAADGIFNFSTVPLTMVFYLGLIISLLSFLVLVSVVFLKITNLRIYGVSVGDVQGFASIIVAILFVGGVQLVCTGVLGEYIGRIYQEVKARPYFIVRENRIAPSTAAHAGDEHAARPDQRFEMVDAANPSSRGEAS